MASRRVAIVVDGCLSAAQQAVQAAHAALDWGMLHGEHGETIVLLEGRDEAHVRALAALASDAVLFEEPDLGMRATAVAFSFDRRLTRKLPLALR